MGKTITGIRIALAALLCLPLLAYSAGLGRFTVNSALGQPLDAEIEIVSLQAGEEDSLAARLASQDAFRQSGMELNSQLIGAKLSIVKRDGRPVIRMTTVQPISEPFLDVLIELQWATGRLVREYTFLLDPPGYRGLRPEAAAPAPAARPAPPVTAVPMPAKPAPRAASRPASAPAAAASGVKQEEVKKGDTLGAIARRNKPDGVTLNQMLIALFRANEDAFIRGNINLVRAGRILNMPDREALSAIGTAEANQLVQSQMSDFAEYKRKLGAAVAAAPAAPVREREVAGRITAKPEAPAPAEKKDQLKLSKADQLKPGAAASRAARDDDRVARERALKESQSRVTDLEKNVGDLQKLVEMKNQQLAELQKKAATKPAAPAPAPAAVPVAKAPEAPKAAPKEAPKAAAKEAPKEAVKEAPKETPKEAPKDAGKPAPKDPPKPAAKAEAKAKPAPVPVKAAPEQSFIEEFIEDPIALGGLGVVVLLLGGYGAWAWRKKKASQSQFQDSVLGASTGLGASSVFASATPETHDTPQPSAAELAASVSSAGAASAAPAESDAVDPIAEADVYMAYGRDAQAEEILREAIGKDPSRTAVHAKLLEIYANRKDAKNFEQTALKLKGLTSGAGPEWEKAMALGSAIDPGNGLYAGGAATDTGGEASDTGSAPAGSAPTLDFDIGGGAETAEVKPESGGLDFDIGSATDFASGGTLKLDTSETSAGDSGLDFDLGGSAPVEDDSEKTMLMPRKAMPVPTADPDATVAMDFDLNLDIGGSSPETGAKADAPIDLGGLSLDLGTPGAGGGDGNDAKWQEVATKLDLAKAYQEMGDKDGARELLNEVVKEGDAAQQGQAQQMLSGLG